MPSACSPPARAGAGRIAAEFHRGHALPGPTGLRRGAVPRHLHGPGDRRGPAPVEEPAALRHRPGDRAAPARERRAGSPREPAGVAALLHRGQRPVPGGRRVAGPAEPGAAGGRPARYRQEPDHRQHGRRRHRPPAQPADRLPEARRPGSGTQAPGGRGPGPAHRHAQRRQPRPRTGDPQHPRAARSAVRRRRRRPGLGSASASAWRRVSRRWKANWTATTRACTAWTRPPG